MGVAGRQRRGRKVTRVARDPHPGPGHPTKFAVRILWGPRSAFGREKRARHAAHAGLDQLVLARRRFARGLVVIELGLAEGFDALLEGVDVADFGCSDICGHDTARNPG